MSKKTSKSRRKQTYPIIDDTTTTTTTTTATIKQQDVNRIKLESTLSTTSDPDCPPRPKSLKLEPEDPLNSISLSTSNSDSTPLINFSGVDSNTNLSPDLNATLMNVLTPSLQRLLSQMANQAAPSPLTPNKIFNPTTISDEQVQIGITFDEFFNSIIRQSQSQALISPSTISNNSLAPNSLQIPNTHTLLSTNANNHHLNSTVGSTLSSSLSLTNINNPTSTGSTTITIPLQNIIPSQDLSRLSSANTAAVLQSHFLNQAAAAAAATVGGSTINFIRSQPLQHNSASNTTSSSTTAINNNNSTMQPFLCTNSNKNLFPLLLCAGNGATTTLNISNLITTSSSTITTAPKISTITNAPILFPQVRTIDNNNHSTSSTVAAACSSGGVKASLIVGACNNPASSSNNNILTSSHNLNHPSQTATILHHSAITNTNSSSSRSTSCLPSNKSTTHTTATATSSSSSKFLRDNTSSLSTTTTATPPNLPNQSSHSSSSFQQQQSNSSSNNIKLQIVQQSGNVSDADRSSHANSSCAIEDDKLERKRARNRDAARKCREKKISLINMLEGELMDLHEQHQQLLSQLENEKKEVDTLKERVIEHKKNGCDISLHAIRGEIISANVTAAASTSSAL